jgi:hypothetical protein
MLCYGDLTVLKNNVKIFSGHKERFGGRRVEDHWLNYLLWVAQTQQPISTTFEINILKNMKHVTEMFGSQRQKFFI